MMFKKLLCWLGIHHWRYYQKYTDSGNTTRHGVYMIFYCRQCVRCNTLQLQLNPGMKWHSEGKILNNDRDRIHFNNAKIIGVSRAVKK
jgi:hypothetical protein